MEKMNLSCGVLLIGSLLWDDNNSRQPWRDNHLIMESKEQIDVPIRYGRKSAKRNNIFTMVFSNKCCGTLGKGYIVPYKTPVDSTGDLFARAIELAKVEGICKDKERLIYKNWGCVALYLSPKIEKQKAEIISDFWKTKYNNVINPNRFAVAGEKPCVNEYGFLNLDSNLPKEKFDLILATPVTIDAARYPTSKEVYDAMRADADKTYFTANAKRGITTFQDEQITSMMKVNN